ncbi:MAG TPA: DUF1398 family protein [Alphaproteobacteria bacterium]
MDAHQKNVAEQCMIASHEGTLNFPAILNRLAEAGFEGYLVDYRKGTTVYYLADGESVEIQNIKTPGLVAPEFRADIIEANVRKSQANAHSYREFCEHVKNAGCAGYLVTLLGKRVVYYGRTGETHVEMMPV